MYGQGHLKLSRAESEPECCSTPQLYSHQSADVHEDPGMERGLLHNMLHLPWKRKCSLIQRVSEAPHIVKGRIYSSL